MVGLLRAWGGAFLVLIAGMAVLVALTPRTAPGRSISVADQAFRIHLPWLVMVALMVPVAALLDRWTATTRRRLAATLPVPALGVLAGAVIGAAGATSAVTALLYVVEGVAGAAAGLFVTTFFGRAREVPAYT
jgi:hypothetical protein